MKKSSRFMYLEEKNKENRWIHGLKNHSAKTFECIFRDTSPRLYRFALAWTMDEAIAQDIIQDVFMHLWASPPSLTDDTGLEKYLYTSVKNGCKNYFKHLQVEDANRSKFMETVIFTGNLEYEKDDRLIQDILQLIQTLPEQQKKVLELKIFKKMSYREIAHELDISEDTVHTHIKRAYGFIRQSIDTSILFFLLIKGK